MVNEGTAAELLKSHKELQGLADALVSPLSAVAQLRSFAAGDPVFQAGMPNDGVYFLISGEVRVFLMSADGEHEFGTLGAGELLGDLALVAPDKHRANVSATKRTLMAFVPLTAIEALQKEKPGVVAQLVLRASRRFALSARGLDVEALLAQ